MKKIVKLILYVFLGSVISLLVGLISEGIHAILTCGIAGLCVSAFLYWILPNFDLKKILTIVSFIVGFFLYFVLYSYINNEYSGDGMFFPILVFVAPYVLLSFVLVEGTEG